MTLVGRRVRLFHAGFDSQASWVAQANSQNQVCIGYQWKTRYFSSGNIDEYCGELCVDIGGDAQEVRTQNVVGGPSSESYAWFKAYRGGPDSAVQTPSISSDENPSDLDDSGHFMASARVALLLVVLTSLSILPLG